MRYKGEMGEIFSRPSICARLNLFSRYFTLRFSIENHIFLSILQIVHAGDIFVTSKHADGEPYI